MKCFRRTKEKYEEEIKDLEKSVNEYKSKYSDTKEKLLNQEDTIINLTTSMKQLQSQLQQAKDVCKLIISIQYIQCIIFFIYICRYQMNYQWRDPKCENK